MKLEDFKFSVIEDEEHILRYSNGYFFIDFYKKSKTYYTEDKRDELLPLIKNKCYELGFNQFKEEK